MNFQRPEPDELQKWYQTATQRNAILPNRFQVRGRYVTLVCGNNECGEVFNRKMLPGRNDPVYVCPNCGIRNYLPVEW